MTKADFVTAFLAGSYLQRAALTPLTASGDPVDTIVESAMTDAIVEFSQDVPRYTVVTCTTTQVTLSGWSEKVSHIVHVEVVGTVPRTFLPSTEYYIEDGVLYAPSNAVSLSVRYTIAHELEYTPTGGTAQVSIPTSDIPTFYRLTSYHLFEKLSAFTAENARPDLGMTSMTYQSKSGEYMRLAKNAYERYCNDVRKSVTAKPRPGEAFSEYTSDGIFTGDAIPYTL